MDLNSLTIRSTNEGLISKKFSARELVTVYLDRIQRFNTDWNVYLTVTANLALKQADLVDKKISSGEKINLLEGVPAAVKDIFNTKDIRTTASSKMLKNYTPVYESTTTQRLFENGMILLGKTNCDTFAFGASTENSGYGPTKNPWNTKKVPGGSSGGSAAAVAGKLAVYSLGTDTGGSIRQPASLCGVTGLKMTYGRGSRYGLIAMASSFDTPGPIAATVEDVAEIAKVTAGYDPRDPTTFQDPVPDYTMYLNKDIKGKRIALLQESFQKGVEDGVISSVKTAVKTLQDLGAVVDTISINELSYGIAAYYILVPSEISSNMARYDAVRFGHRSENANSLVEMQMFSREESLEDEVKRRIMLGNYALSSGYYDAYYLKAARVRTLIKRKFEEAFSKYDAIVCPTSPTVAFDIGSKADDPLAMYLADIFTCPVNIAGLPGISVPCGFSEGLPVGLQFIGKSLDEGTIIQIADAYQKATDWHKKRPENID